jgi:hypothetical protein
MNEINEQYFHYIGDPGKDNKKGVCVISACA